MGVRIVSRARTVLALALIGTFVPALPGMKPSIAWAQKPGAPSKKDIEAARKAFGEGLDFEEKKQWDKALERFEQVAKVRMTPAVRFHIALCKENLGMLIEAVRDFELAESDAKAEKVAEVMKEAPEHAAAIKPKIPKLTLKVPSGVEGLSVTLDGNPIDPQGSEETLVNPGTHKIEATADKRAPFSKEVTLDVGESKTIVVRVPLLGGEPKEEEPPPKGEEPKPVEKPKSIQPTLALIVGGVGVAALLGSGFFALKRNGVASDLESACGGTSCPPDQQDAVDRGATFTTLTNVFLAIGVVGVGTGVVLWATSPKADEPKTPVAAIKLMPSAPGANVGGLSLTGAF